jgi:hypothetical protein
MAPTLVTTNETVSRDLRATLNLQRGVPCGLTWGDFKAAMQLLGVKDDERIASIDYGCGTGTGRLIRDDAPDGVEVRETRS